MGAVPVTLYKIDGVWGVMMQKTRFLNRSGRFLGIFLTVQGVLITKSDAQNWPNQTIKIIVPVGPATPPDLMSRIISTELARSEGWNITVENKVGAVHTLAAQDVLRAPADGHMIFVSSGVFASAPALLRNVKIDPLRDFIPVVKLSITYTALVASSSSSINSVKDLEERMKANPDKLSYASGGFGTPAHLITEFFKQQFGGRANHVPYNSMPNAISDVMNGVVDFAFLTTLPVTELIKSGKMKGIAVAAPQRLMAIPEVSTVIEQGYSHLVVEGWAGFSVRAGTSTEIVDRINVAVNKVLKTDVVLAAFEKVGAFPAGGSSADFKRYYEEEVQRWTDVISKGDIKIAP